MKAIIQTFAFKPQVKKSYKYNTCCTQATVLRIKSLGTEKKKLSTAVTMWDTAYLQIKVGRAARGIENKNKKTAE